MTNYHELTILGWIKWNSEPSLVFWPLCSSYWCFIAFCVSSACPPPTALSWPYITLLWTDGTATYRLRGDIFPNWPSSAPHHRSNSRDSPRQTMVIAFLSRALASLSWGHGGERQMIMPPGLSALPRGCCQCPFAPQIDSQRESGSCRPGALYYPLLWGPPYKLVPFSLNSWGQQQQLCCWFQTTVGRSMSKLIRFQIPPWMEKS